MQKTMNRKWPYMLLLVLIVGLIIAGVYWIKFEQVPQEDLSAIKFETIQAEADWSIPLQIKNKGEWAYVPPLYFAPTTLFWSWEGQGQLYFQIEFTDGNELIYALKDGDIPTFNNKTFIDAHGIPKIRLPKVIVVPSGDTEVSLLADYKKYFGSGAAMVQSIQLVGNDAALQQFEVLAWQERTAEQTLIEMDKKLLLAMEAPYGNSGSPYIVGQDEMTAKLSSQFLLDQTQPATITIRLGDGLQITNAEEVGLQQLAERQYEIQLEANRGYDEQNMFVTLKAIAGQNYSVDVTFQSKEVTETVHYDLQHIQQQTLAQQLQLLDEGVYPVGLETSDGQEIRRQLQNDIKLREPIRDTFRQYIGSNEQVTYPAGIVAATLKNVSSYDLPLLIRYEVLDENGNEIAAFRGEQWAKEIGGDERVPEAVIQVRQNETYEWQAPLYADILHIQEGTYNTRLTVQLFGTDVTIVQEEWTIEVHKERAIQQFVSFIGLLLAIVCAIIFIWKQKQWLAFLTTKQLILIALIAAVKFAIVDIPWFVLGDSIEALLGPLGPFVQLVKGIFSDILQALFMIVLIMLVPKPGVVVISAVVRIILSAVAFGNFNPVTSMLMLSYALIADSLLLAAGFTNGKRKMEPTWKVLALLVIIFALQHAYSTYTYYYIWMYLYRLFYPDWYIHLNAVISIVYASVGTVMGVYLGRHLRKVTD